MTNQAPYDNDIRRAMDACLYGLEDKPDFDWKVLRQARGEVKVKKKLSVGFVLVIILALAAVTALAVGLTNYFSGFAALENTYGEYEKWLGSAKVELVQLMLENGVLTSAEVPQWSVSHGADNEVLADKVLAEHFEGMTYIDTYNAMTRELGSIENWTDEQRALYTSLLERYGTLTDSWPIYSIPNQNDLSREQAVAQARDAVLQMFSVSAEELDGMSVDAIFSTDAYNAYGAPKDEPFWIVEFGYGMAYRVYMTRNGEMIGLMSPQTQFIAWGRNVMDGCTEALPGKHDANREEAVAQACNALIEICNIAYEAVEAMDATTHFFYSDLYAHGREPVWLVTWSRDGQGEWRVLLGYDGSYIDAVPAGKLFGRVLRAEASLSDMCASRYDEMGIKNPYNGKEYFYAWSLEDKVAFYKAFASYIEEYALTHPYFNGDGCGEWDWTRNVCDLPSDDALSEARARCIAVQALMDAGIEQSNTEELYVFYFTTNPDSPEWRFANATCGVSINAYTGAVLLLESVYQHEAYTISHFISEQVASVQSN